MRTGLVAVLVGCALGVGANDELLVGAPGQYELMMVEYLNGQAFEALDAREAAYEQLKTPQDIEAYQQENRAKFEELLGGFPERTPLNARKVGEGTGDGFRYEKVIYESRPGFFVTGVMFLPLAGAPPYPAVLFPCGHSAVGKAEEAYQRACILLARHGIASLVYDPIGQGERGQILDENNKQRFGSTIEHTMVGVGSILLGTNTATYRIWDGIRSLDYLESREDIDASRLGCTGNSGGGTLTSYLMSLDPRVAVAAPSCYVMSFRRLFETIGPQDAEQNIFAFLAHGLGHPDYLNLRAPKPTLICCATRDFFDIEGTWTTFREAKRTYTRLGYPERVAIAETDAEHGFTTELRRAMVQWMQRWLVGIDEPVDEPEFPVLAVEQMQCTPDGQVLLLEGARSVFDINAEMDAQLAAKRSAQALSPEGLLDEVRRLAGIRPLDQIPEVTATKVGEAARDGYRIEKLALETEPGVTLPALAFVPAEAGGDAYLYLHGDGKQVDAGPGGAIEQLVRQGHLVLAADLRGVGESENHQRTYGWQEWFGPDWVEYFRAYQLGVSYVGMRAEDALTLGRYLRGYGGDQAKPVHVIGLSEAAVPVAHAAGLDPEAFASVQVDGSVPSWSETVRTPVSRNQLINTVNGALHVYDWVDLKALLKAP
jgi:dienelactone hydrolase